MSEEYDFVLIGSGVAATLIVQTLLRRDPSASILVLEAGERIGLRDRRSWWSYVLDRRTPYSWTYDDEQGPDAESRTIGKTKWLFYESRVRAYGGSTMHWGGWSLRFKEEDFECRSRTGRGADWPFGYDVLEPWYAQAEVELAVGGVAGEEGPRRSGVYPLPAFPWSVHEAELAIAFEANGLEPGHMPLARFHRCMTTGTCKYCPIGSRFTAQDRLTQLEAHPTYTNFDVRTGATVTRIDVTKARATGVRYMDAKTGSETSVRANTVVLCAGTYESTKLLLRSTDSDWSNGLGNRHDQVGRYLVTHTMLVARGSGPANPERWLQEYDFPTLVSRSWDTPERQPEGKVFLFTDAALPKTDIADLMIEGKARPAIEASLQGERSAGLSGFIEEFGEHHNRLTLGSNTGKFGLPGTVVQFERAPDLEATANRVLTDMGRILESAGHTVRPGDVFMRDPRGDHSSGTLRMGNDPSRSVTTGDLQVHGFDNLYVCSNAVFPTAAAVNPTLTLSALALRLGAHLARPPIHGRTHEDVQ